MQQLIAEVTPHLFIGSYPFKIPPGIDKLVVCSQEQVDIGELHPDVCTIYAPINPRMALSEDFTTAVQTGRAIAGWTRRNKKVLVTCSTGKNRAAVVAAIALMTYGLPSQDAVSAVRAVVDGAIREPFLSILTRLEDARNLRISASL